MRYDPDLIQPMRNELAQLGFIEAKTPDDVDREVKDFKGTVLVVVNSVCGCAAGKARPGVALALKSEAKPDKLVTVFAGQDVDATSKAREYFPGEPPSSPSMGLLKNGALVFMLARQDIEGTEATQIATRLNAAFSEHCGAKV